MSKILLGKIIGLGLLAAAFTIVVLLSGTKTVEVTDSRLVGKTLSFSFPVAYVRGMKYYPDVDKKDMPQLFSISAVRNMPASVFNENKKQIQYLAENSLFTVMKEYKQKATGFKAFGNNFEYVILMDTEGVISAALSEYIWQSASTTSVSSAM
ncbi:MAG: hypothetical protein A2293_03670 [Elusimicrobia bacterium RIFOXYB2_FULL_49_7]|nr:MAG: hypothetical protein A2293_03670 [Elusimicrobia bacterium RIFOXYB2_FULL_49_7]